MKTVLAIIPKPTASLTGKGPAPAVHIPISDAPQVLLVGDVVHLGVFKTGSSVVIYERIWWANKDVLMVMCYAPPDLHRDLCAMGTKTHGDDPFVLPLQHWS